MESENKVVKSPHMSNRTNDIELYSNTHMAFNRMTILSVGSHFQTDNGEYSNIKETDTHLMSNKIE